MRIVGRVDVEDVGQDSLVSCRRGRGRGGGVDLHAQNLGAGDTDDGGADVPAAGAGEGVEDRRGRRVLLERGCVHRALLGVRTGLASTGRVIVVRV